MGIENMCDRVVEIKRKTEVDNASNSGSNFYTSTGDDENYNTIIKEYPCTIKESVSYETGSTGDKYSGKAEMVGILTNLIKRGDLVGDEWKVISEPKLNVRQRKTTCSLARL